jgi:hypothetical protein
MKDFEWRRRPALAWEPKDASYLEAASARAQNTSTSRILKIPQPTSTYGQNPLQANLIGVAKSSTSLELPDNGLLIQGRLIKIRSGYCEPNRPIVNGAMHFPTIARVVSSDDLDASIGRHAAILVEVRIA